MYNKNKYDRIIITGNIGSGKSTLCQEFLKYDYKIISIDDINHLLLIQQQLNIKKKFKLKNLDFLSFKKELSNLFFQDKKIKLELEKIMISLVKQELKIPLADYIIENNLNEENFKKNIKKLIQYLNI